MKKDFVNQVLKVQIWIATISKVGDLNPQKSSCSSMDLLWLVRGVCTHMRALTGTHTHVYLPWSERSPSSTLLYHHQCSSLSQALSLDLDQTPGISLASKPSAHRVEVTGTPSLLAVSLGTVDLNPGPHAGTASAPSHWAITLSRFYIKCFPSLSYWPLDVFSIISLPSSWFCLLIFKCSFIS